MKKLGTLAKIIILLVALFLGFKYVKSNPNLMKGVKFVKKTVDTTFTDSKGPLLEELKKAGNDLNKIAHDTTHEFTDERVQEILNKANLTQYKGTIIKDKFGISHIKLTKKNSDPLVYDFLDTHKLIPYDKFLKDNKLVGE